jgi:5-hydroxyisourate hydrolase
MALSVHVTDCSFGMPAVDVAVVLQRQVDARWRAMTRGRTGADGRLTFTPGRALEVGVYQLVFDLDGYYALLGTVPLHPRAVVEFRVEDPDADLHLPLVVTSHSYLTYRDRR